MFEGILLGSIAIAMVIGGKAILAAIATWPVIGGFAAWYAGLVGAVPEGIVANLVYAVMVAQIIFLPISILLYGPGALSRIVEIVRAARRQA